MSGVARTKTKAPRRHSKKPVTETPVDEELTGVKTICLRCGKKNQANFYLSKNKSYQVNGKIPCCKSCIRELYLDYLSKYNNRADLAIYFTCRRLDIPYVHVVYLGITNSATKNENQLLAVEDYFGEYMKILAFAEKNGWGDCFDDSSGIDNIEGIGNFDEFTLVKRKRLLSSANHSDEFEDIEYDTAYLQSIWGAYDNSDLAYLQNEYLDWQDKLISIDTKDIDIIVKQICYQTLDINKSRENGDDVTKKLAALTNLMNNGGLLEKQNKVVQNTKVVGQRIEDIETYRPIKDVDPDLQDVDNLEFLYNAYVGCTARALGKHNECVERFEELSAPWAIDLIESNKQSMLDGEDIDSQIQGGDTNER